MDLRITIPDFVRICENHGNIKLSATEKSRVIEGRKSFEKLSGEQKVYGANTGVGAFFTSKVCKENEADTQRTLLITHAAGTGSLMAREEARGVMFLLINMLKKGNSGISLPTLEFLIELYNRDIIPAIPEEGSLGASGDLIPLAHTALVLIGEGNVLVGDKAVPTMLSWDFEKKIVAPIRLKSGEALAVMNGTHFMTTLLARALYNSEILCRTADIVSALSFIALKGNAEAFASELHYIRPHPGQVSTAWQLNRLTGKTFRAGNPSPANLQDGYALRCIPQVHGAVKESLQYANRVVDCELNSVSGNPIFVNGKVFHGGNFHGHPLALAADFLCISLTTLGGISERRIYRMLDPHLSNGLPPYLSSGRENGDCGMMMLQYNAAGLLSENKTLSVPASVDSIPTSGGQEDYVSMGALAARKARRVCKNVSKILAIELLCAIKALELRGDFDTSVFPFRKNISYEKFDQDINYIAKLIESGEFSNEYAGK